MYFTLMGKLSARRQNLTEDKDKGFTLIELLVVVIIIGILAAIAIPVYLGVQNNAKDSAVKSDVTNAKTAVISIATSGALPGTATLDSADYLAAGSSKSADTTTLAYTVDSATKPTKFCIQGTSSTGKNFGATDTSGVAEGTCAAGVFTKKS
ncbi:MULTISPECIES: type II secretion system protein [unclassified Frigoribacterium]|uniref:type II secretion system protein n=1 Tax=unclassified Frigoribacterium TaxID=2627005 RepID=UPI0015655E9A|nr:MULTISPECIES: prepilin-type N-terminal cleavage/methylation domain-containing protein [unclassified Frigoribacterium]NQW87890.1 prepilin-type N-terminal cleavage/methylation domain-containing protein [Frigoribacterium sp. VKM Ac-2860]NQX09301.1 prepilin-type N-terminal cleavage/methylation domain-containing protein [Frigoribacterium sp. VKM Ac-2859]